VNFLELIRTFWPIFLVVATLAAGGAVWWARGQFAGKADFDAHKREGEVTRHEHDTRLRVLEEHVGQSPTRQELQEDISQLSERMGRVEAGQEGINRQLGTANNYLQMLVERGMQRP
jgi:hypothetical protein